MIHTHQHLPPVKPDSSLDQTQISQNQHDHNRHARLHPTNKVSPALSDSLRCPTNSSPEYQKKQREKPNAPAQTADRNSNSNRCPTQHTSSPKPAIRQHHNTCPSPSPHFAPSSWAPLRHASIVSCHAKESMTATKGI